MLRWRVENDEFELLDRALNSSIVKYLQLIEFDSTLSSRVLELSSLIQLLTGTSLLVGQYN